MKKKFKEIPPNELKFLKQRDLILALKLTYDQGLRPCYYERCRQLAVLLNEPRRNYELTRLWDYQIGCGHSDEALETALLLPEPQSKTYMIFLLEDELRQGNIRQARLIGQRVGIKLTQEQIVDAVMRAKDHYSDYFEVISEAMSELPERKRQQTYNSLIKRCINDGKYHIAQDIAKKFQDRDLTAAELKRIKKVCLANCDIYGAAKFAKLLGTELTVKELGKIIANDLANYSTVYDERYKKIMGTICLLVEAAAREATARKKR